MATNALVCLEKKDKKIKYLYVGFDGYPSGGGVGKKLLKYYNNFKKISKLLSLKIVSSINNSFKETIKEKSDYINKNESFIFENIDYAIKDDSWHYLYLYKNNQWFCYWYFQKNKEMWIPLSDAIEFDQNEDVENNKKYIEYLNSFPKEKISKENKE